MTTRNTLRPHTWPLTDLLRLSLAPELGPLSQRRLLQHFGTPEKIFAAERRQWLDVITAEQAHQLDTYDFNAALDAVWQWVQQPGRRVLSIVDADYPAGLIDLGDAPLILYLHGDSAVLQRPSLAIVGSRNATAYGLKHAHHFARELSKKGWLIVSGLALGCDSAAHEGALEGLGSTLAVLGTGADRIYPRANEELARKIAHQGLLLSEYALGTPPRPQNFPLRNRLIVALSHGVLVVEAAKKSGAMITARLAGELGREIFALPGAIDSLLSRGCHQLLRDGAQLVEDVSDILDQLPLAGRKETAIAASKF